MSNMQKIREYLLAHPNALVKEISDGTGVPTNAIAARLCGLRDAGHAVSEEAGRSLSNRPILRWRLADTPPPRQRKALRWVETSQASRAWDVVRAALAQHGEIK